MTSQNKIQMIKKICWIGAAADALWAIAFAWPQLYCMLTGSPYRQVDLSLRLALGVAASLMAGWTLLLAWTAGDPIERRAVLAFTAVPVVAGLFVVTLIGYATGNKATAWILVKCGFLGIAMLWSYYTASAIARERSDEIND